MDLNKTLVYASGDIQIIVTSSPPPDTLSNLSNTYYGTHGLKYRHRIMFSKVNSIPGAYFFLLYIRGIPAGTFCLSRRTVANKKIPYDAFYGRYLSILPEFSGKGYGMLLKEEAYLYVKRTYLNPFTIYAFVERKNERSLKLSELQGNRCIGCMRRLVLAG